MHEPLKNCPFCGEAAKHSFNSLYGDMSMASCKSCGATAYAPKWNRRAVLAKWGSPVVAGEPDLLRAAAIELRDAPDLRAMQKATAKLYAALDTKPQPTLAQAGAVPLTQAKVVEAFCALPHQVQFITAFDQGVRFAERHHGIKGETK